MAMHHIHRGTPFGVTVSLRQIALNNQTVPVLHQRMPMKHSVAPVPGDFL
jgi:hypothetical protein